MIRIFSSACLLIRFSIRKGDGSAYHLLSQSGIRDFYLYVCRSSWQLHYGMSLAGFKFSEKGVEKADQIL